MHSPYEHLSNEGLQETTNLIILEVTGDNNIKEKNDFSTENLSSSSITAITKIVDHL